MLNSLARLLLPSVGDILKSLSHLNYSLEAVQGPLAEFDYAINNLAVDIRDGVRLARVVEVLLYSKQHTTRTNDDEDWPLSPHLQYPAPSRAQKMHNVSLVLSTLNKSGGYPRHIEASDIVDGHREKTVGLLWSLLCQYGLALLLDWDQVARETRRFEKMVAPGLEGDYLVVAHDHVELLKHWARNVAVKYGLLVENLTTSFADGRVFAAIVSEYEQYLPSYCKNNPTATLADKLRGIGCNSYFGKHTLQRYHDSTDAANSRSL